MICDGNSITEAYQWIYKWIEENGNQRKSDVYEIECYYKSIDNDAVEEKVEIWVPIA
ncbi:putative transcriptional regulator YdeE [Paenibacillus eucommiae]|uniref:Transcriptional regulator YdeE n=1 Tax=Paenibacillus eucommiae TaxID=1355755 RepID=A0ABS4J8A1_9BACL|nr:putative transcriptional regulator YdeE [Paenibacillus eucommiae]